MRRLTARPWVIAVVYMAGLFVLSSFPKLPEPEGLIGKDKTEHGIAYAGLAAVLFWAVRSSRPKRRLASVALSAIVIASAYGITDELHQKLVRGRSCSIFDWYADILGALTGAMIAHAAVRLVQRLKR